jgi:hypothetical protein
MSGPPGPVERPEGNQRKRDPERIVGSDRHRAGIVARMNSKDRQQPIIPSIGRDP